MSKNKKGKLKKLLIVTGMVILVFIGYVEIINRNSTNMTYRQKFLKAVYPALMWIGGVTGKRSVKMENASTAPATSIYNLSITLNNGSELKLETLKGKKSYW